MRRLLVLALLLIPSTAFPITPPWSTTFNCADYTQNGAFSCDEMALGNPDNFQSCDPGSSLSTASNNPDGSAKGFRIMVNDGSNAQTAYPYVSIATTPELWVRYYMRWQNNFSWGGGNPSYVKMLYVNSTELIEWGGDGGGGFRLVNQNSRINTPTWMTMFPTGVSDGSWHCFEFYLKSGTGDGVFSVWVDGTLAGTNTGLNITSLTGLLQFRVNQRTSANGGCYYNDIDDIAVSTSGYIGPLGAVDNTPTQFTFTDNTGVLRSTVIQSDNVTVAGIDNTTTISISGTGCEYSKNGAAFTSAADNVTLGDNVALHTTSSANYGTAASCVLNMGGVTDTWSVTTEAAAVATETPKSRFGGRGGWR